MLEEKMLVFNLFFFTLENTTSVLDHVYLQLYCKDQGQERGRFGFSMSLTSKYSLSDKYLQPKR